MRSFKSTGGLTRGSGMTEAQRALWTMSMPAYAQYSVVMEELTQIGYNSCVHHKDLTDARMKRDLRDGDLLAAKLTEFSPYATDSILHNIIIGVVAAKNINVHELFSVEQSLVQKLQGKQVFKFAFKRRDIVTTLATSCDIRVKGKEEHRLITIISAYVGLGKRR